MEFNDRVRVIAQTSVEDTGAGIAVDGEVLDAPYVIDVIGEPTTLAGSLDFATGPVDRVRDEGGDDQLRRARRGPHRLGRRRRARPGTPSRARTSSLLHDDSRTRRTTTRPTSEE